MDAAQALGRVLEDVEAWGVDLLTLSSHKLGGPGGAGALWVREGVSMAPLHHGGHQERNRRGGTENVASLVGFGAACETITRNGLEEMQRVEGLRDGLFQAMLAAIPDVVRVGAPESCLGNTLSVAFPGAEGEALLMGLDLAGVAVSSGSACTAGSLEPSHVLSAMGLAEATARAVVRFSLGHGNVPEDVGVVMDVLPTVVARARKERA